MYLGVYVRLNWVGFIQSKSSTHFSKIHTPIYVIMYYCTWDNTQSYIVTHTLAYCVIRLACLFLSMLENLLQSWSTQLGIKDVHSCIQKVQAYVIPIHIGIFFTILFIRNPIYIYSHTLVLLPNTLPILKVLAYCRIRIQPLFYSCFVWIPRCRSTFGLRVTSTLLAINKRWMSH